MKKFLLVVMAAAVIAVLAACAPIQEEIEGYIGVLPGWAIIAGAVALFFIGFGLIWKLIPGFLKVIAIIALAVILAGTAYGLWESPWADKLNKGAEEIRDKILPAVTENLTE